MNNFSEPCEALWTPEQVAAFLALQNMRTLNAWRLRRRGPPWLHVGRLVRYRPAAVRAWVDQQAVTPAGASA